MRVLRQIFGIALIVLGVPLLIAGGAGVLATAHTDDNGAFTAVLAPIHTPGYAVVVPDVADLLSRHRAASLLSPGRLRVTVAPADPPVVMLVVPADVARGYLDGVARTEVTSVGFATGAQPVRLTDRAGGPVAGELPASLTLASGTDVVWDPSVPDGPLSLLVMRADDKPDLTATLTVGIRSGWLPSVSRGLLLGGVFALLSGCAVLLWGARRELTLVVAAQQLVDLADQLQGAVAPAAAEPVRERTPWALRDRATRDLTGELVPVPKPRPGQGSDGNELEDEMGFDGYDRRSYQRTGRDAPGYESGYEGPVPAGDGVFAGDDVLGAGPEDEQTEGPLRAAAARARRWRDRLRNRGRDAAPGRHSVAAREAAAGSADGDDRGESPYIYTAT